ncbi:hypothetical protein V8G54_018534, partial [Vigna mungo]
RPRVIFSERRKLEICLRCLPPSPPSKSNVASRGLTCRLPQEPSPATARVFPLSFSRARETLSSMDDAGCSLPQTPLNHGRHSQLRSPHLHSVVAAVETVTPNSLFFLSSRDPKTGVIIPTSAK